MENVNNQAPVTPAELLTRQLNDWILLREDICSKLDFNAEHLAYCVAQIDRITGELENLNAQ